MSRAFLILSLVSLGVNYADIASVDFNCSFIPQNSLVSIPKHNFTYDSKHVKVEMTIVNFKDQDFRANISYQLYRPIEKFFIYVSVMLQKDDKDEKYEREFLKTVVNFAKVVRGINTNMVTKALMDNFFSSADFEPTFPFKRVNFRLIDSD
jgi:hypothetical protein